MPHHIAPLRDPHANVSTGRQNWLRAAVLGANDGIVSISALVVGVAGAADSSHAILIIGVAGLLAGALSMSVGEYISVSSQRDTEKALLMKERKELVEFPDEEHDELAGIYEKKGLTKETAAIVATELMRANAFEAHAEAELGIDPYELTSPWQAAVASALAFAVGAIIPLVAIVLPSATTRIPITFAAVFVALVITGVLSAYASGGKVLRATTRVVFGGLLAMAITFGVGKLFGVRTT